MPDQPHLVDRPTLVFVGFFPPPEIDFWPRSGVHVVIMLLWTETDRPRARIL